MILRLWVLPVLKKKNRRIGQKITYETTQETEETTHKRTPGSKPSQTR